MKLQYQANKFDRAIAGMVGVVLNDKEIRLNKSEVEILKQAQAICEKASDMLKTTYNDPDLITDFLEADLSLYSILEDC